jgi:hypothetical protein
VEGKCSRRGGGKYESRDMHKQSFDIGGELWMGAYYCYYKNVRTIKYNITEKANLIHGSKECVKRRVVERLEEARQRFLRTLLDITRVSHQTIYRHMKTIGRNSSTDILSVKL